MNRHGQSVLLVLAATTGLAVVGMTGGLLIGQHGQVASEASRDEVFTLYEFGVTPRAAAAMGLTLNDFDTLLDNLESQSDSIAKYRALVDRHAATANELAESTRSLRAASDEREHSNLLDRINALESEADSLRQTAQDSKDAIVRALIPDEVPTDVLIATTTWDTDVSKVPVEYRAGIRPGEVNRLAHFLREETACANAGESPSSECSNYLSQIRARPMVSETIGRLAINETALKVAYSAAAWE